MTVTVLCTYFPSFSTSFQRVILTLGELVSWWVKTSTLKAYYVNFLQPTLPMDPSESCSLHYMAFVIPSKICSTLPELLSSPKMALEIERNYSLITTLLYLSFSDHILSIFFFFLLYCISLFECCYLIFGIFIHLTEFGRGEFWLRDLGYIF